MKLSDNNRVILSAVMYYMMGVASDAGSVNLRMKYKEIDDEIRKMSSIPSIYYDDVKFAIDEFKAILSTGILDEIILQMK